MYEFKLFRCSSSLYAVQKVPLGLSPEKKKKVLKMRRVITAGNQPILGSYAAAHECSVSRYTESTTGRCLQGSWTGMCVFVRVDAWSQRSKG